MNRLCAGVLLALGVGSAHGQAYECRTKDGNVIVQYGVPCAPGTEARNPALEAARRQDQESQAQKLQREREIEAAVLRREVVLGMSREQVARAWGNPARYEQDERKGHTRETWLWRCPDRRSGSSAVTFKNGEVASILRSC